MDRMSGAGAEPATEVSGMGGGGAQSDALRAGVQAVVRDAEELLRTTANYSAEGFVAARARFQDSLAKAKLQLADRQQRMSESAQHAAELTQRYVSENPWKALAIIGSVGMVLGMLMRGRPHDHREE